MRQFSLHTTTERQPKGFRLRKEANSFTSPLPLEADTLTIGIPIKNEEANIETFVKSLQNAIKKINSVYPKLEVEVLFCFNGTTDNSKYLTENCIERLNLINAKIIESAPGKINAMCQVSRVRKLDGWIGFIDADTKVDEDCLVHLIDTLKSDRKVFLVYAQVEPIFKKRKSILEKIQSTHYELRKYLSPRKHFHGRVYIMRTDCFLRTGLRQSKKYSEWILKQGPLVDDIYLSRIIVHEFGLSSIKQNEKAIVSFSPPRNLRDFYFGQRRVLLEIKRLDLLYPEHAYVQSVYFRKIIRWSYLLKHGLRSFFSYSAYYVIDEMVRLLVRVEMLLISLRFIHCHTIWETLKTTKNGTI
jgi:glycosyltransferase involved in cell wall biosynthesis